MPAPALSLLSSYARERLPLRRYGPLALLIVLAGSAGHESVDLGRLARGAGIALVLMASFRLWDDLEDQPRDRAEHPERVLSRASARALEGLRAALWGLWALDAALLAAAAHPGHVIVFLALVAAFFLWYRGARFALRSAATSSLVVLAKYPVFAYLAGDPPADRAAAWHTALAAALVYLTFCAYEVLHDPRVRGERLALPLLGAEMASMIAVSSLMCAALARRSAAAALGHAAIGVASACALAILFLRCRRRGALPSLGQGVFLVCFLQIVSFTAGIRA